MFFRVASLALLQSDDWPMANHVIHRDIEKIDRYLSRTEDDKARRMVIFINIDEL